jgi:predicted Zn-dependent peptidase
VGFTGPARGSPDFLSFNLAIQTLAGRPNTSVLARKLQDGKEAVTSVKVFPLSASETLEESSVRQVWLIAVRPAESWDRPEEMAEKIKGMVKELASRPLPSHELELTRDYLKSSLALSSSTIRGRAKVLAHSEFYRLSDSYLEDYAGLYDHLSPGLVQAVCRKYLEEPEIRWLYLQPGKDEKTSNR